ncbi:MAG: hypothetical protein ACTSVA_03655 [Candidatus Njordarchaeales archaeon]
MIVVWGFLLKISEIFRRVYYGGFRRTILKISYLYSKALAFIETKYIIKKIESEDHGGLCLKYACVEEIEDELIKWGAKLLISKSSDIDDGVVWFEVILEYRGRRILLYDQFIAVGIERKSVCWTAGEDIDDVYSEYILKKHKT